MGLAHSPKIVTDGLVLCLDAANAKSYPGSGTAWTDLTGNENSGTLVNGVGYDSANLGSLSFDGGDDYINTGYRLINGTDASVPITISFWINPDASQNAVTNNPLWIGSAYYSGFGMRYTGSSYQIWLRRTGGTFTDTLPLQSGQFQHVILLWGGEADSRMASYINGAVNSNRNIGYDVFNQNLNSYPFRIGRPYTTGGNTGTGYFIGKISSVSVYNRALSPDEIQQNFNAHRGRFGI